MIQQLNNLINFLVTTRRSHWHLMKPIHLSSTCIQSSECARLGKQGVLISFPCMHSGKGCNSLESELICVFSRGKILIIKKNDLEVSRTWLRSAVGKTKWGSLRRETSLNALALWTYIQRGKAMQGKLFMRMWLKLGIFYISWRISTKINDWNSN